ncbi:MAG TPA: DNA polymerase subunit beta, partial [Candidatus Bathyarchaeota archaeon]|nr:DNA polymerase subunit beta [Candidatus Bathyarchaeota archaeon]
MAKKVARKGEVREVVYDETRWRLLDELRSVAIDLMEKLNRFNIPSIVYGSVARGDVSETSDVDIFVYNPPSSFILETALESAGIKPIRRLIVQATPQYAIKGVLEIDERLSVSFPLVKMRSVERGLYKFGGEADLQTLREGKRV